MHERIGRVSSLQARGWGRLVGGDAKVACARHELGTARALALSAIFSLPGDVCGHLCSILTRSEFAATERGHRARRAV